MICCPECFVDAEIQAIIKSLSQNKVGKCSCCYQENVPIVEIDDLMDFFDSLFSLYEGTNALTTMSLSATIQEEWNIFADNNIATKIVNYLLPHYSNTKLKGRHVKLKVDGTTSSDEIWQNFVDEIKHTNRFFINNNAIVRDILRFAHS